MSDNFSNDIVAVVRLFDDCRDGSTGLIDPARVSTRKNQINRLSELSSGNSGFALALAKSSARRATKSPAEMLNALTHAAAGV